jgi:hypothetical protein
VLDEAFQFILGDLDLLGVCHFSVLPAMGSLSGSVRRSGPQVHLGQQQLGPPNGATSIASIGCCTPCR